MPEPWPTNMSQPYMPSGHNKQSIQYKPYVLYFICSERGDETLLLSYLPTCLIGFPIEDEADISGFGWELGFEASEWEWVRGMNAQVRGCGLNECAAHSTIRCD
ncbi:hypothetical protein AG1IA_01882 [Rhizoctonia solani AG-1 IA]|uniref:Uncharacterized protein n=1 Tax=Thanatephorus cucumeris (strain AG1-IA) TaxID=983506 RepID=L8X173_THACA|nr:hypothetical protein AG1IA_01882 [Rhizoctonia solani AG-1 IA]